MRPPADTELIYQYIVTYKTEHGGIAPSLREIRAGCDIGSLSTINRHLTRLHDADRIIRVPGESRNIRIPGEVYTPPG
ncbi:MAG: hypothetical protein GY938_16935 [Ketobacter sp.]|nr:hypothetical protein [Ketobacter sp.]